MEGRFLITWTLHPRFKLPIVATLTPRILEDVVEAHGSERPAREQLPERMLRPAVSQPYSERR